MSTFPKRNVTRPLQIDGIVNLFLSVDVVVVVFVVTVAGFVNAFAS